MSLVLTFVGLSVAITALLWAASVFLQPYLYSDPADRLPLRAAAGGLILGAFLTFWTFVNTRADSPDKYGTLFEFNPTGAREVDGFEAVRRMNLKGPDGAWVEKTVPFKRRPGKAQEYTTAADTTHPFRATGSDNGTAYMTLALLVPDPAGGDKARFEAPLDTRGERYTVDSRQLVFREKGGSRYVAAEAPGLVYSPNRWAAVGALALNLLHFGLWFAVLWPLMRYSSGAALGGAVALGLTTMLLVMPLLFSSNRPPPAAVATQQPV